MNEGINKFYSIRINKEKFFYIGIIIFAIIKYLLVNQLPMFAILNSDCDDALMLKIGESLRNFKWLGNYWNNTLIKGIMGSLFVATTSKLGLSYSTALILLYIFSCLVFCKAMSYVVKNKLAIFLLYLVLLFNPASMDLSSYQRIYRCALTPSQVLLVFGSFWGLYFSLKNNKKSLWWSIFAGFCLFFFWNTREDSIWILPFVLVITIIMIVNFLIGQKKLFDKKLFIKKISIIILPLAMLKFGNFCISAINYHYYGIFATTEVSGGNFPKTMKYLYAVKPEKKIRWVTVTREKLNRLYEVSPSLNSIRNHLETQMNGWANADRTPGDNEVEDGWFFWAFRFAVNAAGYSDGKSANEFYGKVANEIKEALNIGKLERQRTMPSALMPPWRNSSKNEYLSAIKESIKYLFTFKDTNAQPIATQIKSKNDFVNLQLFKRMTYSPLYVSGVYNKNFEISGWAFSKINNKPLRVEIKNKDGQLIKSLDLLPSGDVAKHFSINEEYVKNCRFSFQADFYDSELYLYIYDDFSNEIVVNTIGVPVESDVIQYCIDVFKIDETPFCEDLPIGKINKVNKVICFYKKYNVIFAVLSIISLLCLVGIFIVNLVKKSINLKSILDKCLIVFSLLASLFVLILGVSYNHTYSCHSIASLYYSGAYSLILAFEFLAISFFVEEILKYIFIKRIDKQ